MKYINYKRIYCIIVINPVFIALYSDKSCIQNILFKYKILKHAVYIWTTVNTEEGRSRLPIKWLPTALFAHGHIILTIKLPIMHWSHNCNAHCTYDCVIYMTVSHMCTHIHCKQRKSIIIQYHMSIGHFSSLTAKQNYTMCKIIYSACMNAVWK